MKTVEADAEKRMHVFACLLGRKILLISGELTCFFFFHYSIRVLPFGSVARRTGGCSAGDVYASVCTLLLCC
jgi:hypothetical protein